MVARRFYTPAEAAHQLGVSSTTVMSLIHSGRLPAVRISERIYRIPIPAFERLVSGEQAPEMRVPWREVDGLDPFGEPVAFGEPVEQVAEPVEQVAPAGEPARGRVSGRRRATVRP